MGEGGGGRKGDIVAVTNVNTQHYTIAWESRGIEQTLLGCDERCTMMQYCLSLIH